VGWGWRFAFRPAFNPPPHLAGLETSLHDEFSGPACRFSQKIPAT